MKKKIISVLSTFLCIIGMSAQVPGSFQYQAVLRNDDGSIASNKPPRAKLCLSMSIGAKAFISSRRWSTGVPVTNRWDPSSC